MSIYDAIMKAADSIEMEPHRFDFGSVDIPSVCGSPGCALGWIGFHAGARLMCDVSTKVLGLTWDTAFYDRMKVLAGEKYWKDPSVCPSILRLYAAKYHQPHFTGIPDAVRNLFAETQGEASGKKKEKALKEKS